MMGEWVLIFARELGLVVWLGGLIVIDFVETPARFRVPTINRNQVVAVGRQVFAAVNRMEVVLGALLLTVAAVILMRTNFAPQAGRAAVACIGLMWAVALAQNFWLRPRISSSGSFDHLNRQEGDPRYGAFKRLHRVYVALELFKITLGLVTLAMWTMARSL